MVLAHLQDRKHFNINMYIKKNVGEDWYHSIRRVNHTSWCRAFTENSTELPQEFRFSALLPVVTPFLNKRSLLSGGIFCN